MPSPIPGWPPRSWAPLATDNPLPGDTAAIRETAGHHGLIATVIAEHNVALRSVLCGQEVRWKGHAADAYHRSLGTLPPELDKVHDRMARIEKALHTWADKLETHQRAGLAALRKAQAAQAELDKQNKRLQAVEPPVDPSNEAQQAAYDDGRSTVNKSIEAQQAAIDDASNLLGRAELDRDLDAKACANALNAAGDDSLKDPDWDARVKGVWWQQILTFVSSGANFIGIWASVAGVALCWVPGATPVLEAIGMAAGIVTFLADLGRLLFRDPGVDGNTLVLDALTTLPFGKVFGGLSKSKAVLPAVEKALAKQAERADFELISKAFRKGDVWGGTWEALKASARSVTDLPGWFTVAQGGANALISGVLPPPPPDLNALPDGD
jgi:uncharacterized protein YukE